MRQNQGLTAFQRERDHDLDESVLPAGQEDEKGGCRGVESIVYSCLGLVVVRSHVPSRTSLSEPESVGDRGEGPIWDAIPKPLR